MKTYLVGGAVRDSLLGVPVVDRDWVVVGATPDEMLAAGFRPVGKDFPVFLHPQTHEEYALARTERKTGPGYTGFEFNTNTSVTLEQDLLRRDLTINAIAEDEHGKLIDPHGGQQDIESRTLRHVSPAFSEDPVRVLRVARFMARLGNLGFSVAEDTRMLMQQMVENGEVANLVAERTWQEIHTAMGSNSPRAFIETLRECDALAEILPEVDALFGVPQRKQYHPEIDSGLHTLMVLDQACLLSNEVDVRFAALCHDLGKGTTPADILPSHYGHEERSAELTQALCKRLRVPGKMADLAILSGRYHLHAHRAFELGPKKLLALFQAFDVIRRPERFSQFLLVCEADARGRGGAADTPYPQAGFLESACAAYCSIDAAHIAKSVQDKSCIKEAIRLARLRALKQFKQAWQTPGEK